jgi:hypothetical protein
MYLKDTAFAGENKTKGTYRAATGKRPAERRGDNIQTSGVGRNGKDLAVKLPARRVRM